MNRVKLMKAFVIGVLMVGLWVILVVVYLFSRQEIIPNVTSFQNQSTSASGTIGELLASRRTDHYNKDFELEDIFNGLNKHTWERYCQSSLEQLCNYPIFPKAPDKRNFVQNANIMSTVNEVDGAVRLLGYVQPNTTGEYQFLVTSNGFAEVWLSPNTDWKDAMKIAYYKPQYFRSALKKLSFEAMKPQISDTVSLLARQKYFFEVIYVKTDTKSSEQLIQVAWKRPDRSEFELIEGEFFSLYTEDSDKAKMKIYDDELPDVLACEKLRRRFANKYMRPDTLPYLTRTAVDKTLPLCEYRPSYLLNPANLPHDLKQYHGVKNVQKTYTYPFQSISGVLRNGKVARTVKKTFIAEFPLSDLEALSVIRKYCNAMKRTYSRKYELQSIKRVEKKEDPEHGSRYLLELVVKDLTNGTNYILAEYVFQPGGKDDSLCYPKGLQWDRAADVYLILTAKNLGRWVHHFIKNVEQIVQETNDEHLHVVIFDFDSPDIDLEQAFKRSTLKNYHFITQPGNYSRTVAFSKAIESIKNPDVIIVTIDMHLDLGSQLINDIRKLPNVSGLVTYRRVWKWILPEYPLNKYESLSVIHRYFEAIRRMYPEKYELQSIKRVEKKEDPEHGSRYLLELVVKDLTNGTNYILAEYEFQPRDEKDSLCYPKGLQWDRASDVYLILTANNLGRWVHHFIKNVEQIVQETNDEHLHVVIFDFDSPDIDLEQAFKRSTLKNYHFITQPGNYSRTVSLSKAIESIKNPDAIIVTIDMHLDIGSQLINDIRKHCIKGKTLYAPQIVHLSCDGSSATPNGHWFHYSYGTVAVYKEDWEKFGGFSKGFDNKVTWGGEDWDIIDGAVKGGLEIERKRSPAVYHYYHTKAGMWQKAKKATKGTLGKNKT